MKLFAQAAAVVTCTALSLSLAACSNDDSTNDSATTSASAPAAASSREATPALPTVGELNDILALAADPNRPVEEKLGTVQGGETAPELFDIMVRSKEETGADFHVVDPVLPDMVPNSVVATIIFTQPDQPDQPADNVRFVFEDGRWKLSKDWACTLINQVVPDQMPPVCADVPDLVPPAPASSEPAPEGAPASEGTPAPEAPADAPAPEGAPAS